jgi:pyrroline-5-carboxylate reductase
VSFALRRVAVLGAGTMGETLLRALLSSGAVAAEQVVATARRPARRAELSTALGIGGAASNAEAAAAADLVFLCVKPQLAAAILAEIEPVMAPHQLLVSILAGIRTTYLEERLRPGVPVVRAMPNTPALVGAGMTALAAGAAARPAHVELVARLFGALGRVAVVDERGFDAVTGLSASGPAFLYVVIEALAEGGVKMGLPRNLAIELAAQTCLGAGKMVLETGDHPALLKDAVTTPAGCTVDGILKLEEGGLRVTLIKAVMEAARRAGELLPGVATEDPEPR